VPQTALAGVATNSQPGTLVINMSGPAMCDFQTNGVVPFYGFSGLSTTIYQSVVVNVMATSGGPYLIVPPANCHMEGTPYVTNWTICSFYYTPLKQTNLVCLPVY
jgi:hypothetical protein